MTKINAKRRLAVFVEGQTLAQNTADMYERLHNEVYETIGAKRMYDAAQLHEWLQSEKGDCTHAYRSSYVNAIIKVLKARRPEDPRLKMLEKLRNCYKDPVLVQEDKLRSSAKKHEAQNRHRDVKWTEMLTACADTSDRVAEYYDHEKSIRRPGRKIPISPDVWVTTKPIDTRNYRMMALFARMLACNPPARWDGDVLKIKNRMAEGETGRCTYDEGIITFNHRLKDRAQTKINHTFDVHKVKPRIDEFIANLPPAQVYMFVNSKGEPFQPGRFGALFRNWSLNLYGESLGIIFLRTKSVEDNPEFVRGCIDCEYRGHSAKTAFDHYVTEEFRDEIRQDMQKEKGVVGIEP